MKQTTKQIIQILQGLQHLSEKNTESWYVVDKNIRKIQPIYEEFEASKKTILEKFAERDEKGKIIFNQKGNKQIHTCSNEPERDKMFEELLNEEHEINFYQAPIELIINEKHPRELIKYLIGTIFIEQD